MPIQQRRHTVLVSLLAGFLLIAGVVVAAPADAGTAADEQLFVQLINQTRAQSGLPALTVNPELTQQARSWASSMAATDQLAHAPDISTGITAPWTVLGENVGVHGIDNVGQLHDAFVASPGHYANIVDPRYTSVGVGVVVTEGGKLWTTHRFMATTEPAPTTAPPATTEPPTTAPPITASPTTASPTTASPTTRRPTRGAPTTVPAATPPTDGTPTTGPPSTTAQNDPTVSDSSPASDGPSEAGPDEQAPPASADGTDIEPIAGPGRPDLETVEQMLLDLIEAGI